MRKIISFMHMSLDGFVASANGGLDWVTVNEEIFNQVEERIKPCDTALYGRVTFDMMEGYWPTAADKPNPSRHDIEHSRWYKNVHKLVMSNSLKNAGRGDLTVINGNLQQALHEIKNTSGEDIPVFGSPTATHALMEAGLIDGFWIFLNPVILGDGIPLFKKIKEKSKLKLIGSDSFSSGVIELNYVCER